MTGLEIYRRDLPHWRLEGSAYFVTWRLNQQQPELTADEKDVIASCLTHFEGERYRIHTWVIMPDHVHVVLMPLPGYTLENILHSWKSFSANQLQRKFQRQGAIWQREYMDRIMRDETELLETCQYVLDNPTRRWPDTKVYRWAAIGKGWE